MRAFILDRYKPKDGGHISDVPLPAFGDSDVLIQVFAAGVNPLDSKIRNGDFKLILPYGFPLILGNEFAGKVVKVGARVRRFKPGDEVYGRPDKDRIGSFAEYIAADEADLAIKPKNLTMVQAASLPLVGLTAWQALIERANLQQGQRILVHAGSGGVGTMAIQLAKHLGATVATTTSAANAKLVRSLGADIVVDYKKDDFVKLLRDYDVVLCSLDAMVLEKSLAILKPGGKLISISGPPDPTFAKEAKLNWLVKQMLRVLSASIRRKAQRKQVSYSFLFMRASGEQLQRISSLVESGALQPVIDKVYSLVAAKDALAYVDTGRSRGKVVIKVLES